MFTIRGQLKKCVRNKWDIQNLRDVFCILEDAHHCCLITGAHTQTEAT